MEVCYDGVWSTVCSRGWSSGDAAVVCRQLGYSSTGTALVLLMQPSIWYMEYFQAYRRYVLTNVPSVSLTWYFFPTGLCMCLDILSQTIAYSY